MINNIAKLIIAMNSNVKKSQIAAGIAWGLLLGLVPLGNFFWIVLFLVSFFFHIHHGLKLAFMFLFKLAAVICAPSIDMLGWEILHITALQPLFTSMYNMPFVPFTQFNNTLVAGGLVAGIVLWLPVFLLLLPFIGWYRNIVAPKIRNSKLAKAINKIPFVALLQKAAVQLAKKK